MSSPTRTRAVKSAFVAGTFAAVTGCSLLVQTEDLQGGAPKQDAATNDVALVDSAADARAEAGAGDAQAPCDATFCDDFDDGPLGARWDSITVNNGATLDIDGPTPRSGAHAIHAIMPQVHNGDSTALLEKSFGDVHGMDCSFAVRVASASDTPFSELLTFTTDSTGAASSFTLDFAIGIDANESSIREDVPFTDGGCGCPRTYQTMPTLPLGTWVKVRMQTDFKTATVWFDDVIQISGFYGADVDPTNVRVRLGSYSHDTSIDLQMDDLVCTATP